MKQSKLILISVILIILQSCGESTTDGGTAVIDPIPANSDAQYSSDLPYQLNVFYFIPKDLRALPQYQERISSILLNAKQFIKKNMTEKGYANSSMGLLVDKNNLVKINVINGKLNNKDYNYNDDKAADRIKAEIETFYAQNANSKRSEHVLVLLPSEYGSNNEPIASGPFYGIGTYCYAIDYPDMDQKYLGTSGRLGELATKWIGGLVHELGHGLNINHDKSTVSDQIKYGESLMAAGNYTYEKEPTHVTKASCSVLNTSQIFQKNKIDDMYGEATLVLSNLKGSYSNSNILFTGDYKTNKAVNEIDLFLDPEGDDDYNQVGFVTSPNNSSFEFKVPISELEVKKGKYELNITFLFKNGFKNEEFKIPFQFKNGIPDLNYKN